MAFTKQQQDRIYKKTDGYCHICRKKLARKNYGKPGSRGAWEVEHSNPKAKGGSDRLQNLYPACVSCNRSKQASSTQIARRKNGFKSAPLPRKKKKRNALIGGLSGAVLGSRLGPLGAIAGAAIGAFVGGNHEPK